MCNCGKNAATSRTLPPPQAPAHPLNNVGAIPAIHSRDGSPAFWREPIDPAIWGPHVWTVLHTLAEFVPAHGPGLQKWTNLLKALLTSLPCPECTEHYSRWCATHPLVRRVGQLIMVRRVAVDIKGWLLNLHNDVNQRRGVAVWNQAAVSATYGGDHVVRMAAVRVAIDAVRGMVGDAAINAMLAML
jgi:hypothetical protein